MTPYNYIPSSFSTGSSEGFELVPFSHNEKRDRPPELLQVISNTAMAHFDAIRGFLAGALPIHYREFDPSHRWEDLVKITNVKVDCPQPTVTLEFPAKFFTAMHTHLVDRRVPASYPSAVRWFAKLKCLSITASKTHLFMQTITFNFPSELTQHPLLESLIRAKTFETDKEANKRLRSVLQIFFDNMLAQAPKKYFSIQNKGSGGALIPGKTLSHCIEESITTTREMLDATMSGEVSLRTPTETSSSSSSSSSRSPVTDPAELRQLARSFRFNTQILTTHLARFEVIYRYLANKLPKTKPAFTADLEWEGLKLMKKEKLLTEIIDVDILNSTFTLRCLASFYTLVATTVTGVQKLKSHAAVDHWFRDSPDLGAICSSGTAHVRDLKLQLPDELAQHPHLKELAANGLFKHNCHARKALTTALTKFYKNLFNLAPVRYFKILEKSRSCEPLTMKHGGTVQSRIQKTALKWSYLQGIRNASHQHISPTPLISPEIQVTEALSDMGPSAASSPCVPESSTDEETSFEPEWNDFSEPSDLPPYPLPPPHTLFASFKRTKKARHN